MAGNTLPKPPRLSGNPAGDIITIQGYLEDLYRTFSLESDIQGTQDSLTNRVTAAESDITALQVADATTATDLAAAESDIAGLTAGLAAEQALTAPLVASTLVLQGSTTGAASDRLTTDGAAASASNVPVLPGTTGERARQFRIEVTAEWTSGSSGAAGDCATWALVATLARPGAAATTTVVGGGGAAIAPTHSRGDGASWTIDVAADTTLAALDVTGNGAANNTVTWRARVWRI